MNQRSKRMESGERQIWPCLITAMNKPINRFPTMKVRIMAEINPRVTYAVCRFRMGNSMTVAERT